jgi:chromosomal replication initiation ATPase DnaA
VIKVGLTRGQRILHETAQKHLVAVDEIRSACKLRHVVRARWEVAYRLRHELQIPYAAIGRFLRKDHATIIHACRSHKSPRQPYERARASGVGFQVPG